MISAMSIGFCFGVVAGAVVSCAACASTTTGKSKAQAMAQSLKIADWRLN
jgi:hypothetical protein